MSEVKQSDRIVFEDVSKFYGEILGVNRVNLSIPPGVTSLVGPNGSGKTTLMNLMTGLSAPPAGESVFLITTQLNQRNSSEFWGTARNSMRSPKACQDFSSYIPIFDSEAATRSLRPDWRGVPLSAWVLPMPRPAMSRPTAKGCGSASGSRKRCVTTRECWFWTNLSMVSTRSPVRK